MRQLEEAEGYLMLDMPEEAWRALEHLPAEHRNDEPVLLMRLSVAQCLHRWKDGAEIARKGAESHPGSLDFYIMGAYCIRRAENLQNAHDFLRRAEKSCPDLEALWFFNMACYEAQLGNLGRVGDLVRQAVQIDSSFRALALEDEDLKPWWDSQPDSR